MAETIERVMVITAHPDDSEFGAGGTVARMVKEGREVTYVVATSGNSTSSLGCDCASNAPRVRSSERSAIST